MECYRRYRTSVLRLRRAGGSAKRSRGSARTLTGPGGTTARQGDCFCTRIYTHDPIPEL